MLMLRNITIIETTNDQNQIGGPTVINIGIGTILIMVIVLNIKLIMQDNSNKPINCQMIFLVKLV